MHSGPWVVCARKNVCRTRFVLTGTNRGQKPPDDRAGAQLTPSRTHSLFCSLLKHHTHTNIPFFLSLLMAYNQTQTVHNPAMKATPNHPIHRDGSPLCPALAFLTDSAANVVLYPAISPPVMTSRAVHTYAT